MMSPFRRALAVLSLAAVVALVGCGGTDGGPAGPTSDGASALDTVAPADHSSPADHPSPGELPGPPDSDDAPRPDGDGLDGPPPADVLSAPDAAGDAAADVGRDAAQDPDVSVPVPRLCFQPPAIDFGEIPPGREVGLEFAVASCGTLGTRLVNVDLSPESSGDFRLESAPDVPLEFPPAAEAWIDLRYRPTGGDTDHGSVVVTYVDEVGRLAYGTVAVHGTEPPTGAAVLAVAPEAVRFEGVLLGAPVSESVALGNEGGIALSLLSVALGDGSHEALSLDGAPIPGLLVQPGGRQTFRVVFAPSAPFPRTSDPLGEVVVRSNDPTTPARRVPIFATSGAPYLEIEPAGTLEFGVVGQRETVTAVLTLRSVGGAPLEILGATIAHDDTRWGDEFRIAEPPPLAPPAADGLGSLPAGQSVPLPLTFTNNGPDSGEAGATLILETDDEGGGRAEVRLLAQRALDPELPPSGVVLEPAALDFGTLAVGETARLVVTARNRAGSARRLTAVGLAACDVGGGFGWSITCDPTTVSPDFAVATPISPDGLAVPPGGAVDIAIDFAPSQAPANFSVERTFRGQVRATVVDPALPGEAGHFELPESADRRPNVQGRVGYPSGFAWPPTVSFGDVLTGCGSGLEEVSVIATRPAALRVFEATLDSACDGVFALAQPATFPPEGLVATPAAPQILRLAFRPPATGPHACTLHVRTNDPGNAEYLVTLTGDGVEEARVEDDFVHRDAPPVDVLFIVDDSGSMCQEQGRLAANLDAFIHYALDWGNDFRIGVVSTCVHDEVACGGVGRLRSEHAPRRWVGNDTWDEFLDNVLLGCWGGSDPQEAGLQAAFRAITAPNATLTAQPCADDTSCAPPAVCLDDLAACGGTNGGFLRDDAALEIVVLSDEEDQSDQAALFYARFFGSFRSHGKGGARLHAIVGDEGTGCVGGGTAADPGDRYIEVARATRGIVASICDDSFADPLSNMGEVAFGTRWTYYLSHRAAPDSVIVSVDGLPCTEGWTYDADANAVVFTPGGPCTPQDGSAIGVKYDRLCL